MREVALRERKDGQLTLDIEGMDEAIDVSGFYGSGLAILYKFAHLSELPDELMDTWKQVPLETPYPGYSEEADLLLIACVGMAGEPVVTVYPERCGKNARSFLGI